ncbi:MAG TPA: cbb3-type cytochrome c oxidase subunit 3 [Burkholderiales bacterium]|jgi:cytochrome c oxidase cbb3-type subunit IV|nr:cbb3-type cytochrome c oxidase subunit 3 [Burkholderiales bacterium]
MDVNTLRAILTLVCFLIFAGIVVWAWSSAQRKRFDEAARVPLEEDANGTDKGVRT